MDRPCHLTLIGRGGHQYFRRRRRSRKPPEIADGGGKALSEALPLGPLLVTMKAYEIKGQFRASVRRWQPFTMEVASADEAAAVEKTMALIGSRHRVKRPLVKIEKITSVKPEDLKDQRVKHLLEASG